MHIFKRAFSSTPHLYSQQNVYFAKMLAIAGKINPKTHPQNSVDAALIAAKINALYLQNDCKTLKRQAEVQQKISSSLQHSIHQIFLNVYRISCESANLPDSLYPVAVNVYKPKPGVWPSKALKDLLKGPVSLSPAMAIETLFLKAIYDGIGEKKFNALFTHRAIPLTFGYHSNHFQSPLTLFTEPQNIFDVKNKPSWVGSHVIFSNARTYPMKHPAGQNGECQALYIAHTEQAKPLFWSLDFLHMQTADQIKGHLIRAYNQKRTQEDEWTIQILQSQMPGAKMILNSDFEFKGSFPIEGVLDYPEEIETQEQINRLQVGAIKLQSMEKLSTCLIEKLQDMSVEEIKDKRCFVELAGYQMVNLAGHILN